MPLTAKGEEIKRAMTKEYGSKKGEEVFYASRNKGMITGVDSLDAKLDAAVTKCVSHETRADSFDSLVAELERKGYSKDYATKIAGKVAAEKGMTGKR